MSNPFPRNAGGVWPEALAAMDEAFEDAFKALDDMGQPKIVREVVARIIEAATAGSVIRFAW
jgi:hypothetical protein